MRLYKKLMEIQRDPNDIRTICMKDRDGEFKPFYYITTSPVRGKLYSTTLENDISQQTVDLTYLMRTAVLGGKGDSDREAKNRSPFYQPGNSFSKR